MLHTPWKTTFVSSSTRIPMRKILSATILLLVPGLLWGQSSVFPGDANANGVVDQYDVLSIGYVFGDKVGAFCYNLAHHRGIAIAVYFIGIYFSNTAIQL